jgi:hypothetical protein
LATFVVNRKDKKMPGENRLELVIDVDASGANSEIREVNQNFSSLEFQAARTARNSSVSFDGMTGAIVRDMSRSRQEIYRAKDAAELLGQQVGITLPRSIRSMLAESDLIGPALTRAFGLSIIAVFALEAAKLASKIPELVDRFADWSAGIGKSREELAKEAEATRKVADEVRGLRNEISLIGTGGVTTLSIQAENASGELDAAKKRAGELRNEYEKLATQQRQQEAKVQWQRQHALVGSAFMSAGIQSGINWVFGVSQKEVDESFRKYQEAQQAVRKAQVQSLEAQSKLAAEKSRKEIDLALAAIDAQREGKEVAGLILAIKKEESVKAEALANNYRFIAEQSERNLITLRAQLKVAESFRDVQREQATMTVTSMIPEDVLKRFASTIEEIKGPLNATDEWLKNYRDEQQQFWNQRDAAERINFDLARQATSEKMKALEIEDAQLGKITPLNAQEKMVMDERRADLNYRIAVEKVEIDYRRQLVDLAKEERDLTKDITVGVTPELQAALDAKRTAIERAHIDELGLLRITKDREVEDVHRDYALQQIQTIRDAAGHIFDDMLSSGRSIWQSLLQSFKNIFLIPVRAAFQDLAQSIFAGMRPQGGMLAGAAAGIPSIFGGGGGLGSIFGAGIPGGGIGTPPFIPSQTQAAGGFGLNLGGFGNLGTGLKQLLGLSKPAGFVGPQLPFGQLSLGGKLSALGHSNAALLGGATLALMGIQRGGLSGLGMTTAGGALIGFKYGGPIGALIGGGIGAVTGLFGLFRKSAEKKVREKVKATYNVDIQDKAIRQQIVDIAKQAFSGNLDMAIRSSQVADLVRLYALTTGQSIAGLPGKPQPLNLAQKGGSFYEEGSYSYGRKNLLSNLPAFAKGIDFVPRDMLAWIHRGERIVPEKENKPLPSAGLTRSQAGNVAESGPTVINITIPGAKEFFEKETIQVVHRNPRTIQSASAAALRTNFGRRELTSMQLQPGTLVS